MVSSRPGPPAPDRQPWARVVLAGLLAGVTSGLFGVGGGSVIVPALVMLAAYPHKLATGTSLTAIIPIALSAVVGYAAGGEVDWAAAGFVAGGAVCGAVAGTRLLVRIRTPWLQLAFAALLVVAAVRLFAGEADGSGRTDITLAMAVVLVLLGLASGLLAGLLGVGGGVVIVPALTVLFGVPHVLAKGTSLAVIVPTAVIGTVRNRRSGLTALRPALVVGASGVVSAWLASQVSLDLDARVAQALFGGFLVVVSGKLAWEGRQGLVAPAGAPEAAAAPETATASDSPAGGAEI